MDQNSCKSLQSCFSFLICEAYGIIEFSVDGLYLHQKKPLHWAFLTSFQPKCNIEKAELLTEISSSLELVLLEWSCNMQWLECLNKWSSELRRCFSAVNVLSSQWTLYGTIDLRVASWVFTRTVVNDLFHWREERGSVSLCMSSLFAANYRILEHIKPVSQTPQSFQLPCASAGNWEQLKQQVSKLQCFDSLESNSVKY